MIFYHLVGCNTTNGFNPQVVKNRAGFYVAFVCQDCGVINRESGYYDNEMAATDDLTQLKNGQPMLNPHEPETDDEQVVRRLKAARLSVTPDTGGEFVPDKPAKITVNTNGSISMSVTDPLGAEVDIVWAITPWGFIGVSGTGFNSIDVPGGYLVIAPASSHEGETQQHIEEYIDIINRSIGNNPGEIQEAAPGINT